MAPHKGAIYVVLCVNAILVASGVFDVVASGDGASVGLHLAQRVEIFGRALGALITSSIFQIKLTRFPH